MVVISFEWIEPDVIKYSWKMVHILCDSVDQRRKTLVR